MLNISTGSRRRAEKNFWFIIAQTLFFYISISAGNFAVYQTSQRGITTSSALFATAVLAYLARH
jgi:hypothetical protein